MVLPWAVFDHLLMLNVSSPVSYSPINVFAVIVLSVAVMLPLKLTLDVASMDKVLLTPEILGVITLADVEIVPVPVVMFLLPVSIGKLNKVPPDLLDILFAVKVSVLLV